MANSLLFLPDISGFTEFVQSTEVEHSQHVIAELLEVLVGANTQDMLLAEVEGDALFFYKEEEIPSAEKLLAQVETMFTAFYSHLKLLEKNRVCPCNACATAHNLQLKIIAHSGSIQFITVQNKRKPFGGEVIDVHRLMKNSVDSDNYVLFSESLMSDLMLPSDYKSRLYQFVKGEDQYEKKLNYAYSVIDNDSLKIKPFAQAKLVSFDEGPAFKISKEFTVSGKMLLEYITNYSYRHEWLVGVDRSEYDENEVTRLGTEHVCVIDGRHLNFVTVIKNGEPGQLVYGELTSDLPMIDEAYQFFVITPQLKDTCRLDIEFYPKNKSIFKSLIFALGTKRIFKKGLTSAISGLGEFVARQESK